jgi:tetratricopeptide (TPR) repeat protein
MSLSVCLLTRNEEDNIKRAVRSFAGVADEIVVADTGSTDRTVEVAAELGAKVLTVEWGDDFAAGRNCALAQATGDWIFWLNPDEELLPESRRVLPRCLAMDQAIGFIIRVQDQLKSDRPAALTETNQPRLFRRDCGVQYRGRLHPYFAVPLDELGRRQGKLVFATTEVILRRHAYLSVLNPQKLQWAKRLLELELRDRPGQLHYLIEYGRTLLLLNDPRGHEFLATAVNQILTSADSPTPPVSTAGSLFEYLLTVAAEQSRSQISLQQVHDLALRWFRKTPPVVWALAQNHFRAGQYAGAASLLESLLEMGRTKTYDQTEGFDPEIIGAAALMNLGICRIRLGELDQALGCFGQLLAHPVHQTQARKNYRLVQELRTGMGKLPPPDGSVDFIHDS